MCNSIITLPKYFAGVSINFVKNDDIRILRDIEQYYSTQIDEMPMNGKIKLNGSRTLSTK